MKILKTYEDEFKEYLSNGPAPLEMLRNPHYRAIIDFLLSNSESVREDFFGKMHLAESIDNLLEVMEKGRPLYNQWVQKIGSKERVLSVPKRELENFLGYFKGFIKTMPVHEKCHGGEQHWTPRKSLEAHLPCQSAFSFDLASAFENLRAELVFGFMGEALYSLNQCDRRNVAGFFAILCTVKYEEKRGLPQGASISMPLFNRILYPLDCVLSDRADEKGMVYSRWVDDITISSSDEKNVRKFFGAVDLVMNEFPIVEHKIFFQNEEPVYLLGHKIVDNKVLKNSAEERLKCKVGPLNLNEVYTPDNYRNYAPWG